MAYAATVLADNPLRYYRLDEVSGSVAADLGSQAQFGTLNGGITLNQTGLLAGDADPAMLFDGTSGYISLPITGLPIGAAAWSMEAWVQMANVPVSAFHGIVGFGTSATNQDALLYYNGGNGHFTIQSHDANVITAGLTPTNNQIVHLVVTYDGTTAILYINGSSVGSAAYAWSITAAFARIGQDLGGSFFGGVIDEVAFYSTTLSAARVLAHYKAGTPTYTYGSAVLHDTVNYDLYQKSFNFVAAPQSRFKIAHRFGMKKVAVTQNERQIKVVVRVNGTSRVDLEAKIDTLFQGLNKAGQRLSLHLLDTRYFVADCIGAVLELAPIKGGGFPGSGINWADVSIDFICANPYALGVASITVDSGVVNTIASTGGTYTYYQEVSGTAGTVFTRPQVRITQSGTSLMWTSLTVQQLVNNQQLILTSGLPVTSGDYLDLFCDPLGVSGQSVQRNSSGVPLAFTGLFPVLEPIPTAWRFIVAAPSRPSIRVQWTYTPRFLT